MVRIVPCKRDLRLVLLCSRYQPVLIVSAGRQNEICRLLVTPTYRQYKSTFNLDEYGNGGSQNH